MTEENKVEKKITEQDEIKPVPGAKLPNKAEKEFERSNSKYHKSLEPWD